METYITPAAI